MSHRSYRLLIAGGALMLAALACSAPFGPAAISTKTAAPILSDTSTALPIDLNTPTPAPSDTPAPTASPTLLPATLRPAPPETLTPTGTAAASDTPAASATISETPTLSPAKLAELVGTGVKIETAAGGAQIGQGRLVLIALNGLGAPIGDQFVTVHTEKQDLTGGWVVDQQVASGSTDPKGQVGFDLAPTSYIVSANWPGYNWGSATGGPGQAQVPVDPGQTTTVTVSLARLTVGFVRGDNTVITAQFVRVFTQKPDVTGQWVTDQQVASGSTDNGGVLAFDLPAGYYIVASDLRGYSWGSATDVDGAASVPLAPGAEDKLIVHLGQLQVGLVDAAGKPLSGQFVRVFKQQTDASGNPALADQADSGSTDNTGAVKFDLAPGNYAIQIGTRVTFDMKVQAAHVTVTDGVKQEVR